MKNFNISVCFFHLNQTVAEPLDRVSPKADLIWENLIKLSEKLPFTELKELKSKLVCYEWDRDSNVFKHKTEALNLINLWLTEEQKPIELAAINQNGLAISGSLQPFLLHDTYAFDLTLFPENSDRDIAAQDLSLFQPNSLFLDCSENTLGETIWFYGQSDIDDAECQYVADRLVKKFLKDTKFTARLVGQGKLFKAPLFEYEISQKNQPNKLYKILVWIDNQAINPEITPVYDYLLGSLWTRYKIEYAYEQGRESYSQARKVYSEIEAKIREFKQNQPLEELQKLLESMPELSMQYQRQLRNMQAHYTTIETNQTNYQDYLKNFWQPGDISTWQEFGETTCKRYLDQIKIYLSYIQPGKDLIGEFINTLRGLVEIEQAKFDRAAAQAEKDSDQKLQNTIQAVGIGIGVGIGVAGILASSYPLIEKPWEWPSPQNLSLPPHPFIVAFCLSLLGGGLLGLIAWFITESLLDKNLPNRSPSNSQLSGRVPTSLPSSQNQPIQLASQQPETVRSPNSTP